MEDNLVTDELVLNEYTKNHLRTTRKWVFGISIIGLMGTLFLFSVSIYNYVLLSKWGDIPPGAGVGLYLMVAVTYFSLISSLICFLPFYYLNKFSTYLKMALEVDDSELLEISFRYLKLHYKSIGILLLVYIAIYVLLRISF